jgi:hypothetical protein
MMFCHFPFTNKQKETVSNGQKKTELRTSKASIIYQNKATAKTKSLLIKSAPTKSQTFPRKKMSSYSTSTPGTKDVRSSEGKMAKHHLVCKGDFKGSTPFANNFAFSCSLCSPSEFRI